MLFLAPPSPLFVIAFTMKLSFIEPIIMEKLEPKDCLRGRFLSISASRWVRNRSCSCNILLSVSLSISMMDRLLGPLALALVCTVHGLLLSDLDLALVSLLSRARLGCLDPSPSLLRFVVRDLIEAALMLSFSECPLSTLSSSSSPVEAGSFAV